MTLACFFIGPLGLIVSWNDLQPPDRRYTLSAAYVSYRQVLLITFPENWAGCTMMEESPESASCDHFIHLHVGAEKSISYSLIPILIQNLHNCDTRYSYSTCLSQIPSSLRL